MKSGNLNFQESSGPLQACNGTDLPSPLPRGDKSLFENGKIKLEDRNVRIARKHTSCGVITK